MRSAVARRLRRVRGSNPGSPAARSVQDMGSVIGGRETHALGSAVTLTACSERGRIAQMS